MRNRQDAVGATRGRRYVALASVAIMLNAIAAGGASAADEKTLVKFPTATFLVDTYATDFVGKELGIFEKHGLDVTFAYPPSGATAAQLLLAGEIRGWNGPMDYAIQSAAKGADLKMAGMPFVTTTDYIVVSSKGTWPARNASFEEKIKALKGKTVGVSGIGAGTATGGLMPGQSGRLSADAINKLTPAQYREIRANHPEWLGLDPLPKRGR